MDGSRFDAVSRRLTLTGSRRGVWQALAASVMASGLSALGAHEAAAKCNKTGQKCKKDKECCGKACKGGKCRCAAVRKSCAGGGDNACCGDLTCNVNACNQEARCSQPSDGACTSDCDCQQGLACRNGGCCRLGGPVIPGVVCCFGITCNPPGQNCVCIG